MLTSAVYRRVPHLESARHSHLALHRPALYGEGVRHYSRATSVQSVTTARKGRSDDIQARQRRYLWMMGIRIACLPLAIIVQGWARWVFITGAVVLPYVAVVIANAVARPQAGALQAVDRAFPPALTSKSHEDPKES